MTTSEMNKQRYLRQRAAMMVKFIERDLLDHVLPEDRREYLQYVEDALATVKRKVTQV